MLATSIKLAESVEASFEKATGFRGGTQHIHRHVSTT